MRIAVVFGTRSFLRLFGNIGAVRTFGTIRTFGIDHKIGIDFLQRSFLLFRKALLLLFLAHTLAELAFAVSDIAYSVFAGARAYQRERGY